MSWTSLGTVSITATLDEVVVGTVDLPPTGGLEVRIKQISPAETSVFSAGRFFVRTASGRTYGTKRFWGHLEGEDYQLGDAGFTSDEDLGQLVIQAGRLNLRALKATNLSPWVLEVSVRQWQPAAGGGGGTGGDGGGDGGGGTPPLTVTFSQWLTTYGTDQWEQPAAQAFDDRLETKAEAKSVSGGTTGLVFTPQVAISYTSSLKVYLDASGVNSLTINGSQVGLDFWTNPFVLAGSGTLASLTYGDRRNGQRLGIYGIEVDGVVLVDGMVWPPP